MTKKDIGGIPKHMLGKSNFSTLASLFAIGAGMPGPTPEHIVNGGWGKTKAKSTATPEQRKKRKAQRQARTKQRRSK